MASAAEGAGAKQNIAAALVGGLDTLSLDQEILFTQYVRLVLPLDGFVFWVRADLLSSSAQYNAFGFNEKRFNEFSEFTAPAATMLIKGSLHYSTNVNQDESETEAVNTVIFTAEEPIQKFNDLQPSTLWIGERQGDIQGYDGPIEFAFSSRGRYYEAADLYHYVGTAVLPAFKAQLITKKDDLVSQALYVSNSLPVWLSLSTYQPPYYDGLASFLPLYPSFAVPDNLEPPYGAVHVIPGETTSMQGAPAFDRNLSQQSLSRDLVRVTLYGLTNEAAATFLGMVMQYSYDYNYIGIMNMPVIRDEKRIAPELGVLAQKKTIEFEVSYQQGTVREVDRQWLESVIIDYLPQPISAAGVGLPVAP